MREPKREVHLFSNGRKNDTLHFSRNLLPFGNAVWSDLCQLKIAKVRSNISDVGRCSFALKCYGERTLLRC